MKSDLTQILRRRTHYIWRDKPPSWSRTNEIIYYIIIIIITIIGPQVRIEPHTLTAATSNYSRIMSHSHCFN